MRRILLPAITLSLLIVGPATLAFPQVEQKKEELPHPKTLEELR